MYWLVRSMCPLCVASFASSHFSRTFSLTYVGSSWRFWYWIYFSVKVPASDENVCVGDRPLSGVLLSLSFMVMLGVGDGYLNTDCILGRCSELLYRDLIDERDCVTACHSMMTKHRLWVTDRHSMTKQPSPCPPPRPPPRSLLNCPWWPLANTTWHSSHIVYRISMR